MTNPATPQGGEAQPIADVNSVQSILDSANPQAPKEIPESEVESVEPVEPAEETKDEPFPKKAINALSRRDKQIGKLRAEREQLAAELEKFRQVPAPNKAPQSNNNGEPQEKDFTTYHEYIRAINKFDAEQLLNAREGKQEQTRQSQQEREWVAKSEKVVADAAQTFIKENPEAQAIIDEYGDVLDELPPQIKRIFLEAGESAPLAVFNLVKAGKIEELGSMSPARAAMEIGRAMTQAVKPKTKAPTPLPAARGSVPGGKSLEQLTAREAWKLLNPKD
jgi:hypothetical protein